MTPPSASAAVTTTRSGWWLWLPALVWAALIFGLSSISVQPTPPGPITDKHEHFVVYGVLCALILRALAGGTWRGITVRTACMAVALTSAYGLTDELHQSFVPLRDASSLDLVADALGALAAAMLLGAWAIIRRRR